MDDDDGNITFDLCLFIYVHSFRNKTRAYNKAFVYMPYWRVILDMGKQIYPQQTLFYYGVGLDYSYLAFRLI